MEIKTVGVIGAGTMGSAIAELFAFNGFNVVMKDQNMDLARSGYSGIEKILNDMKRINDEKPEKEIARIENYGIKLSDDQKNAIRKKIGVQVDVNAMLKRISLTDKYSDLSSCDLVIEAAFENQDVKNRIFSDISDLSEHAIIASNTSSLSITEMSSRLKRPENALILHFFNPPYLLPLVEVVPSLYTSDEAKNTAVSLISRMKNHREGMVPVMAKEREGFIVNRLLIPLINSASDLLDSGVASAEDIDTAMKKGAGFPMGPLELADMIGIDVVVDVMEVLERAYGERYKTSVILRRMREANRLGRKTRIGFYKY
ncbi:beta-hydroxybutyryl-CoA dehydrogenase related protein [Thermoplasma acidophilum]|uniref:Beta-hydroxybutyryl-CoA dehydrogenase related protein n=1 Tax=Thermoplasma acidophilum (strain ATCC 25905 / DSM 1728 / JCM 9062 / NBRC 15155 / AMRC-C165) TaxID=273075 RepID=Q9HJM0_THEAC|nr:3-hydroxyacyl-CoA dehydrogenase family protein [Thermoplasma acidophilum]CAC12076.1 beta-hydroxybutyryl-CoA dehydrogenase related protein [Thermoplasma acidophilum]